MAFGKGENSKLNGHRAKKADVIIEMNGQISAKADDLTERVNKNCEKLDTVLAKLDKIGQGISSRFTEMYNSLHEEYNSIRREMKFIATQNERIFLELSSQIHQLAASIGGSAPVTEAVPAPAALQLDEDELADKIALKVGALKADDFDILVDEDGCSSISESIAQKLNCDAIVGAISEKVIQAQKNNDYEVVIDEEGLNKITEYVTEEISKTTDNRLEGIERELSELKKMLASGAINCKAVTSVEACCQYVSEESTLVTVSDVTQDEPENSGREEFAEEIAELVEEIDEIPVAGEILPDDLEETSGGVDFENMMKYNRSFIARIIQSTDEQKEYYGRVKTALLSYAKVNSNIAWGAERFNKGRETIARFKIRGKTLCLYLALDPKDFEYSVYYHIDVSDNKSMHGTPMMVKIKSPRGAQKAIRLIDEMLARRNGVKRTKFTERNYAAMYPYESMEELIEDGLVKDVSKNK